MDAQFASGVHSFTDDIISMVFSAFEGKTLGEEGFTKDDVMEYLFDNKQDDEDDCGEDGGSIEEEIFEDGSLELYISNNIEDPWNKTKYKGYVHMSPKQKGEFGERFTEKHLTINGFDVKSAPSSTSGYDRIVNGKKCEIKYGLATRKNGGVTKDSFIINHVSKEKDWDFLLFIGINSEKNMRIIWFKREDFKENCSVCFNIQQGGKKIDNDDYMCTRINDLIKCDWVHEGIDSLKNIMFKDTY